jgi:L-glyceraldehyde 3-phosphate reductase
VDITTRHDWHPITIYQSYYHMLTSGAEQSVLPIAFCPLAQALLAGRYLDGIPEDSRANVKGMGDRLNSTLNDKSLQQARDLNAITLGRGETLAQLTLAWTLRDPRVTSLLIGASKPAQILENVKCLDSLPSSQDQFDRIDAIRNR